MDTPSIWKNSGYQLRSPSQIRKAIQDGADPNYGDPLMVAVDYGSSEQVKALLDCGAIIENNSVTQDTANQSRTGWFIRHSMVSQEGAAKLVHLANSGMDIAQSEKDGNGLFFLHSMRESPSVRTDIAHLMFDAGADPTVSNEFGSTALHSMAAAGVDGSVIDRAVGLGANVNAQGEAGRSPLFLSSTPEITQRLLSHGADPTLQDKHGSTAAESPGAWSSREEIQRAQINHKRLQLSEVAQSSRPDDLASPDDALTRRSRGRRM